MRRKHELLAGVHVHVTPTHTHTHTHTQTHTHMVRLCALRCDAYLNKIVLLHVAAAADHVVCDGRVEDQFRLPAASRR